MGTDDIFELFDSGSVADLLGAGPLPVLVLVVVCSGLLRALLERDLAGPTFGCLLGQADDLGVLQALVERHRPTVSLVDLSCPNALNAIRLLAQPPIALPVLALGDSGSELELLTCVRAGATGYLSPQTASSDQLVESLIALRRGRGALSLSDIRVLAKSGNGLADGETRRGPLTGQQRRVVDLAGAGRTNREIASALSIEVSRVKKHLNAAFSALGVSTRADLSSAVEKPSENRF